MSAVCQGTSVVCHCARTVQSSHDDCSSIGHLIMNKYYPLNCQVHYFEHSSTTTNRRWLRCTSTVFFSLTHINFDLKCREKVIHWYILIQIVSHRLYSPREGATLSFSSYAGSGPASIFHSKNIRNFKNPPKNIWNFTNPKKYHPFSTWTSRKDPKMHRNDPLSVKGMSWYRSIYSLFVYIVWYLGIGSDIRLYSGQTTYNEKIVLTHTPMM